MSQDYFVWVRVQRVESGGTPPKKKSYVPTPDGMTEQSGPSTSAYFQVFAEEPQGTANVDRYELGEAFASVKAAQLWATTDERGVAWVRDGAALVKFGFEVAGSNGGA